MLIWVVVSILPPQLASAAKIPPLPPKWIYVGCLNEGNGSRIMTDVFWAPYDLTLEKCVNYCVGTLLTRYAALEVGNQCFCGDHLNVVKPVYESNCNYPCVGDSSEMCGGYGFMTFFSDSDYDPRVTAGLIAAPQTSTSAPPTQAPATTAPAPGTTVATTVVVHTPTTVIQSTAGRQPDTPSSPSSSAFASSSETPSLGTVVVQPITSLSGTVPVVILSSSTATFANATTPMTSTSSSVTTISKGSSTKAPLPVLPTDSPAGSASSGATAGSPKLRDNSNLIVFGKYASSVQSTYRPASLLMLLLIAAMVYQIS